MARGSSLGPLPWTEQQLWRHPSAWTAIRAHPGYPAHRDLEALKDSREIFDEATAELVTAVRGFHAAADEPGFWGRLSRASFEARTREIRRRTFTACTAAIAWRDHARAVSRRSEKRKRPVPEWDGRWQAFTTSEVYQFIAWLRDRISHAVPVSPDWHRSTRFDRADNRHTTTFLLRLDDLPESGWTAPPRTFIEKNPKGVDVEDLFLRHRGDIAEFHDWLSATVAALSEPELSDYRGYETILHRISVRNAWTLLLQVANPENADRFLKRELTPDELAEIEALPPRSRARADRVIEILDEHGACTDEFRRRAYKAMEVTDNAPERTTAT